MFEAITRRSQLSSRKENLLQQSSRLVCGSLVPCSGKSWRALNLTKWSPKDIGQFKFGELNKSLTKYCCHVSNGLPYLLDPFVHSYQVATFVAVGLPGPIMTGRAQCLRQKWTPLRFRSFSPITFHSCTQSASTCSFVAIRIAPTEQILLQLVPLRYSRSQGGRKPSKSGPVKLIIHQAHPLIIYFGGF